MNAESYVKMGTLLLLGGTAIFTYAVVQQSSAKLLTHFVVELSQNLYFVGLSPNLCTVGGHSEACARRARDSYSWCSLLASISAFLPPTTLFGICIRRLSSVFVPLVQVFGTFLPLAWAYAFWYLPEEARMVPSRLAVIPR